MELKIISKTENKTIGRTEIEFSVFSDSQVKRDEVKAELCKSMNASPNSTIIVSVNSGFGSRMNTGTAHSYRNEDDLKRYENKGLLERLGIIQKEEKKKAAPAAAPKAEAKK
jgi:ribosomal protein S24E